MTSINDYCNWGIFPGWACLGLKAFPRYQSWWVTLSMDDCWNEGACGNFTLESGFTRVSTSLFSNLNVEYMESRALMELECVLDHRPWGNRTWVSRADLVSKKCPMVDRGYRSGTIGGKSDANELGNGSNDVFMETGDSVIEQVQIGRNRKRIRSEAKDGEGSSYNLDEVCVILVKLYLSAGKYGRKEIRCFFRIKDFVEASNLSPVSYNGNIPPQCSPIRWRPLDARFVKLNFDGSVMDQGSTSGFVIRNESEDLVAAGARFTSQNMISVAECLALRDDLWLAKDRFVPYHGGG
ncbi:hypothetical protein D8674_003879 [Pyrus ussuriensis x Pyrus communis]|uniref:Uncharacterized protein n=1 Tax=Pyrus ussuriensis x Pyrus communis TaxID=2448454 RepID=A0A5N5FX60_9ROSA|nr:hypothetical protein D8674_003879 [Pyrus ussuriensis x Pyrus communis]